MPVSTAPLYSITAQRLVNGRPVDLLGYRTARANEIDDVCQELRRELRPAHGNDLSISVDRA
ncbi:MULTISPECIES: hypothetical protein [unclassified Streptomyces]|uniref:hypothetical protein n=1 Tax=unclassified Streptomyces TaxID=2593676 RepID=UPI001F3D1BAE|nr:MULTISPECIES: hypothetical protein [unclassified Streptomyces]MCF0086654.1 hypothetical protein [Streptomyces sp. MH192]MCF0098808.1 hypothetical protein [Streptomyces sp. MH191]